MVFTAKIFSKYRFRVPFVAKAPNQDFRFLKNIVEYESIDQHISKIAVNHLWYQSQETIALSFIENKVSCDTRRKMVSAMKILKELDTDQI